MRAHVTAFLTSGFPGISADVVMDDEFFNRYLQEIPFKQRTATFDLRTALGAPTLVVEVATDAGAPLGVFTWRFHRVRFGDTVGDDTNRLLIEWYKQARELLLGTIGTEPLPESWIKAFEAPAPVGVRQVHGVPPDPPALPRCHSAPATFRTGPFLDGNSNCYNYACNKPAAGPVPALPGRGTSFAIDDTPTVSDLREACKRDKLRFLETLPGTCADAAGHIVALINRPPSHRGYHFFRLNQDGTWSHKDGSAVARNFDDTEPVVRTITSLTTAEFAYPYEFVGYFYCPPNPGLVD